MKRCPFYKRKLTGKYFSGIKCSSDKLKDVTLGNWPIGKWKKEERDKKLEIHCFNDYKKCQMYKKHIS